MTKQVPFILACALCVTACDSPSTSNNAGPPQDGPTGKADDPSGPNAEGSAFAPCFDHDNDGRAPADAATAYRIDPQAGEFPGLVRMEPRDLADADPSLVYRHMVEDVRFTTYKCWDQKGDLTGFDIEMITEAAFEAGFDYIEFVPRPWSSYQIEEREYLSLLIDLVVGMSDGLSAGMSITEERLAVVDMVGPIYKAGKKLMARNDNERLSDERRERMLEVPAAGYDALAGLSVITQAATIRSDFFRELEAARPELVEYLEVDADGQITTEPSEDTFQVLEVEDFAVINAFIDAQMAEPVHGRVFDLVMIDTGSSKSLIEEGKLGVDTEIVTGNLSADPELGGVFGTGDGISFAKDNTELSERFRPIIAAMIRDGRVDALVEQWFADDNAADPSWAQSFE